MRILLINNHSILNAGDYAILLQTLRLLEQAFPGARVALSFNDAASARGALAGYPIHSSPLTWAVRGLAHGHYEMAHPLLRLIYLATLALGALIYRLTGCTPRIFADSQKQALFEEFATADLILGCGGGYLYAPAVQISPIGWFTFTVLSCVIALVLGKPLVLLPQSIGPLCDLFQYRTITWIVRRSALIFVREQRSLHLLQQLNCAQRTLLAPDLAFGLISAQGRQAQAQLDHFIPPYLKPAFRVGMTALNWNAQNHTFAGQSDYEQAMVGCINAISDQGGLVVLFAQSCGPTEAEDDRLVNLRLRGQARCPEQVIVINEPFPPDMLQGLYGCMDYFIGTRMHSVILALNAGVPAMAIGYLTKTRGVLGELGLTDHCYEISTLTTPELVAGFERLRHSPEQTCVQPYLRRADRIAQALPALIQAMVAQR